MPKNDWLNLAHFGLLRLNQPTVETGGGDATAEPDTTETDPTVDAEVTTDTETVEGEDALGDPGKKALAAMKERVKAAERAAREAKEEAARIKAEAEGRLKEFEAEKELQRVKDEALAAANERILKAEVRALAATRLADPEDALRFLDISEFDVDDDGNVDQSAITEAIADLITQKPYLAAQGGARFNGSADQGVRNAAAKSQLTEADLDRMTPEEIAQAKAEGRLDKLLGRRTS